jgi:hypothetical protein
VGQFTGPNAGERHASTFAQRAGPDHTTMLLLADFLSQMHGYLSRLSDRFTHASAAEFGYMAVVAVMVCWFVSRYCAD